MSVAARPATTVVLLRPESEGYSVFMVQRNRAVGFMPSAWVFPGGRVESSDELLGHPAVFGGQAATRTMGVSAEVGIAYLVAAVRETYEEAGVWLGDGGLAPDARQRLNAGGVALAEILGEATLSLDRLLPWAWWVTPSIEPKRFDTRFFVAIAEGHGAIHDDGETVASRWIRADEAVALAESGELPMAPPTWWTLCELAALPKLADVIAAAAERPHRPIEPIGLATPEGFELRLPGHPEHPEPAYPGLPSVVRFSQGRWWADGTRPAPPFIRR